MIKRIMNFGLINLLILNVIFVSGCISETSNTNIETIQDNTEVEPIISSNTINCTELLYRFTADGYYNMSFTQIESSTCRYAIIAYDIDHLPITFDYILSNHDLQNLHQEMLREMNEKWRIDPFNTFHNSITNEKMYWNINEQKWIIVNESIKKSFNCDTLSNKNNKYDCYFYKAIYTKNETLCNKITDEKGWANSEHSKESCIIRSNS